ncbi:MAG: iron chelate uptake ABC transporter family permease subunit, partial [Actinomycetaceae bacterium]|nr:iron chelate uptake ABC transporter family permease subunit [Actinomycetaceae bacterium]
MNRTAVATSRMPHALVGFAGGLVLLMIWSLTVGTASLSLPDVLLGRAGFDQLQILTVSRLPRTLAIVLSGASMAVAGLVMQMLVQNRYVEPST